MRDRSSHPNIAANGLKSRIGAASIHENLFTIEGDRLTISNRFGAKVTAGKIIRIMIRPRYIMHIIPGSTGIFAKRISQALVAALFIVLTNPASLAQGPGPKPQGAVRAQFGDWQVVCKPPPPGAKKETCALVQSVTAEDRNNVGLTVYFQKFTNGTKVLRVFAPVGVLLPPGLGLKIDDIDVGHAPFIRCHTFACYAQVQTPDDLVAKLKNGKTAVFIIFQTEEAGIGIPISLKGFAQALQQLK